MRTTPSIAESVEHDLEAAESSLKEARTHLINAMQQGFNLSAPDVDAVKRAESVLSLWTLIDRKLKRQTELGDDREAAARIAVVTGRRRALEIVMFGASQAASLTHRAHAEVEIEGARMVHVHLTGYED
ncbi:hypothetical protein ABZT26_25855 [Streptomyces sp. NPDC005395]|uniref:hypothetical protein n=1 Tax=Streptomyces sp. NPDC005395 TaxID=3157042 RepID=UPI0033A9DAF0